MQRGKRRRVAVSRIMSREARG
uniref:Uncharacterized protein n=1 Tax=Triticum urartu TaxID=4572 RepID=A0A8R7QRP5_TRIUA